LIYTLYFLPNETPCNNYAVSGSRKTTGDPTSKQKTLARLPTQDEYFDFHRRGFTSACLRWAEDFPIHVRGEAPPCMNKQDLKDPVEAEAVNAT